MRVSVCIPTFNGKEFVAESVESILGQTYTDFELVISDDHSSESTLSALSHISDRRIRISQNEQRLGLVGNWNRCLELARGELVHIFHQDDVMAPDGLMRLVGIFDQDPALGLAFSNINIINASGIMVGGHWTPVLPKQDHLYTGRELFGLLIHHGNLIPCPTVVVKAELYKRYGVFDQRLRYTPDLEMWLRLCLHTNAGYIAYPTVSLRRHKLQESSRYIGNIAEVVEVSRAFEIIFREHGHYIGDIDSQYKLALSHLVNWSWIRIRASLRHGRYIQVARNLLLLLGFLTKRSMGYRIINKS